MFKFLFKLVFKCKVQFRFKCQFCFKFGAVRPDPRRRHHSKLFADELVGGEHGEHARHLLPFCGRSRAIAVVVLFILFLRYCSSVPLCSFEESLSDVYVHVLNVAIVFIRLF